MSILTEYNYHGYIIITRLGRKGSPWGWVSGNLHLWRPMSRGRRRCLLWFFKKSVCKDTFLLWKITSRDEILLWVPQLNSTSFLPFQLPQKLQQSSRLNQAFLLQYSYTNKKIQVKRKSTSSECPESNLLPFQFLFLSSRSGHPIQAEMGLGGVGLLHIRSIILSLSLSFVNSVTLFLSRIGKYF